MTAFCDIRSRDQSRPSLENKKSRWDDALLKKSVTANRKLGVDCFERAEQLA